MDDPLKNDKSRRPQDKICKSKHWKSLHVLRIKKCQFEFLNLLQGQKIKKKELNDIIQIKTIYTNHKLLKPKLTMQFNDVSPRRKRALIECIQKINCEMKKKKQIFSGERRTSYGLQKNQPTT